MNPLHIFTSRVIKDTLHSTATPLTSGGSFEWYYIVGVTSAFIVCAVVVGCCIYRCRRRGEWKCLSE